MKESERIDVVLRGLYEYKESGSWVSPREFIPRLKLEDEFRIANWLINNGYASGTKTQDSAYMKITSDGIFYCEDDSQSRPGKSVISVTYIQNTNSPGAIINVGIVGQVNYQNESSILDAISDLKISLHEFSEMNLVTAPLIAQFLDELYEKVENSKQVPGFFWNWLENLDTGSSLLEKLEIVRKMIDP